MPAQNSNPISKTVLAILFVFALVWIFGMIAGAIFQSESSGALGTIVGLALAFGTGYLAVWLTFRIQPHASPFGVRLAIIAFLMAHCLAQLGAGRSLGAVAELACIVGVALVRKPVAAS